MLIMYALQHVDKAEDRVCRKALGVRQVPDRIKGPIDIRLSIDEKNWCFVLCHHATVAGENESVKGNPFAIQ